MGKWTTIGAELVAKKRRIKKDVHKTHKEEHEQPAARLAEQTGLEVEVDSDAEDEEIQAHVDGRMGDEGCREPAGYMGAVPPTVGIRGNVPKVRDAGAWEKGQDGEGQSPQGHEDDTEDAGSIRPRPLLKDAQVLEEQ